MPRPNYVIEETTIEDAVTSIRDAFSVMLDRAAAHCDRAIGIKQKALATGEMRALREVVGILSAVRVVQPPSCWGMETDVERAIRLIASMAVTAEVPGVANDAVVDELIALAKHVVKQKDEEHGKEEI